MDADENSLGGYKEASAKITGKDVFAKLKFESGAHRVQRVPVTESQGRVHTSAATVAVLPEIEEVDMYINPADLKSTFIALREPAVSTLTVRNPPCVLRIFRPVWLCSARMTARSIKTRKRP